MSCIVGALLTFKNNTKLYVRGGAFKCNRYQLVEGRVKDYSNLITKLSSH